MEMGKVRNFRRTDFQDNWGFAGGTQKASLLSQLNELFPCVVGLQRK